MFVDAATLQDLEVVPTPMVRGTTLWSLLDRTRTRAGSDALRNRLQRPAHSPGDVLALQRAHQQLSVELSAYREALDAAALDEVERYLNLTWQLPQAMPPMARVRKWYRQYVQDVERGQFYVSSLLRSLPGLSNHLIHSDAVLLRDLGDAIAAVMENAAIQQLRRFSESRKAASTLRFDQAARGGARAGFMRLITSVAELEALWSVGAATREHGWIYPQPSSQLRVSGLVHPFLGTHAVPNDLHLASEVRVCFVTGPNMAGKSTFLRAIGLALLLAHIGSGVPAASMQFAPAATLFSSVQIADNLSAGESFYLAEVRRIGALASALDDHGSAVAVIDEPFRGTNVHDAAEATLAVVTRLAAHAGALVFVASHVGEVVPAILGDSRITLLNFAADMTGDRPTFDYRLREGVSEQRLGMTLLRQEGVLDRLERSARSSLHVI